MENKYVGYLVLGISVVITSIIFIFNRAMKEVANTCPAVQAGYLCPAHETVTQQTYFSLAIVAVLVVFGLVLVFSKPQEKVIIKQITEKKQKQTLNVRDLRAEDKAVLKLLETEGAIFQAELIERTGFAKAKVTRILDRLEGRGLVERKRRGMTNVVVLKA